MTVDDAVAEVSRLLGTPEGQRKTQRLITLGKRLLQDEPAFRRFMPLTRARPKVAFYINAGNAGPEKAHLSVRVCGVECGTLDVRAADKRTFKPTNGDHFGAAWPEGKSSLQWERPEVRRYIDEAAEIRVRVKRPEAEVESLLIREMRERSGRDKLTHLLRHRPVLYPWDGGFPLQIPLPISASDGRPTLSGGHIDVLARFGNGKGLRVFEVKRPKLGSDAASALAQAVIYGATLKRLFEPGINPNRVLLRLYGKNHPQPGRRIDAVAFVEDTQVVRAALDRAASQLRSQNKAGIGLRAMLYRLDGSPGSRTLMVTHEVEWT